MKCLNTCLLRTTSSSPHVQKRMLIAPRALVKKTKKNRLKVNGVKLKELDPNSVMPIRDSRLLELKVKQLQEFTRSLREQFKSFDQPLSIQNTEPRSVTGKELQELEREAATVFESLTDSSSKSDTMLLQSSRYKNASLSDLINSYSDSKINSLLPEVVRQTIGDDTLILKSLMNQTKKDWNPIIDTLWRSTDRLKGISQRTLKKFFSSKIRNLTFENIEHLDEMLLEAVENDESRFRLYMYELLFENLAILSPQNIINSKNDPIIEKMKELLNRFNKSRHSFGLSNFILNSCITYTAKLKDASIMNYFFEEIQKKHSIQLSKESYTTVIQFYERLNLNKQAWDVFDTMKFLSSAQAPDAFTYNIMLKLCSKENNYSRACDLFQEMNERGVTPNRRTFAMLGKLLAKCSSDNVIAEGHATSLRMLGWKFISQLKEKEDYTGVEAMMSLASYDGDIALCRALYFKFVNRTYNELRSREKIDHKTAIKQSLNPVLFNYLLLSYSKYQSEKLPLLLSWDEGGQLRRDLLNSVDYTHGLNDDGTMILPFLPVLELNNKEHIILESNALWNFHIANGLFEEHVSVLQQDLDSNKLLNIVKCAASYDDFKFEILRLVNDWKRQFIDHKFLNAIALTTYLSIPLRHRVEDDFWSKLKRFSFQTHDLDDKLSQTYKIFSEKLKLRKASGEMKKNDLDCRSKTNNSKINDCLYYVYALRHKVLRDCAIYELALKGATAFGNVDRATEIWQDRGKFRHSNTFSKLPMTHRIQSDVDFAKLLIDFFITQGKFLDALKIVMSSKRYIEWKFPMIRRLYQGLLEREDHENVKKLMDIVNRKTSVQILEKQIEDLSI
ncbi:hypothetical protein KAFR_0I00960 [Kazachstania africana CBS 2517]|uniref:Mitochondrial group I intron splicing factor CCM1 n=1 Tax=Kazachstania africana (strain ATCC 22294 / BCRC 22015 / CBS 2517 / CECT 1963 / NBRC 1671 / NRRL Y-8276) TaxID=1071382 RepID=H2AZS7_KAZAF|nr:hypothetical protein KAFR_0I00960 [Kazachstania africana CBS 2517]CCF59877.1 hypothetical protein KAFR_0I00960 [Kazachstania africana CBS 2517]